MQKNKIPLVARPYKEDSRKNRFTNYTNFTHNNIVQGFSDVQYWFFEIINGLLDMNKPLRVFHIQPVTFLEIFNTLN